MGRIHLLLKLGRFHFLAGGILLFLIGAEVAILDGSPWDPFRMMLGYLILFGAHLSVSYTNDYFDMDADKHNVSSPFSGGSGVLQRNPELAKPSLFFGIALIILSFVFAGIYSLSFGIDPIFLILVISGNALGWSYTAPPLRLAYRGFGEVSTSITVGILVTLFGFYVMAGKLTDTFFIFAVPMALYGTVFILDVQIPDMEADRKGGKRTIVTAMGRRISFTAIAVLAIISTIGILSVGLAGDDGLPFSMKTIALLTLIPLAMAIPPLFSRDLSKDVSAKFATMIMGSFFLMFGLIFLYLFMEINGILQ